MYELCLRALRCQSVWLEGRLGTLARHPLDTDRQMQPLLIEHTAVCMLTGISLVMHNIALQNISDLLNTLLYKC